MGFYCVSGTGACLVYGSQERPSHGPHQRRPGGVGLSVSGRAVAFGGLRFGARRQRFLFFLGGRLCGSARCFAFGEPGFAMNEGFDLSTSRCWARLHHCSSRFACVLPLPFNSCAQRKHRKECPPFGGHSGCVVVRACQWSGIPPPPLGPPGCAYTLSPAKPPPEAHIDV